MIKNALGSFSPAIKMITGDKINMILAGIPIAIGLFLYYSLGSWAFGLLNDSGKQLINNYISEGSLGSFVYWLVTAILTVILAFIVNFTFVLVVSLISSPFNDLLSSRVEKNFKGEKMLSLSDSLSVISGKLVVVIFNESKKISFIVVTSAFSFVFSLVPFLAPVAIVLNILLLAVGFVDYTWSRKDLAFKSCLKDLRKNVFGYSIGGGVFFVMITIPLINLLVAPLATSYFTVFWIKNNEHSR